MINSNIASTFRRIAGGFIDLLAALAILMVFCIILGSKSVSGANDGSFSITLNGPGFYAACLLILSAYIYLEFKFGKTPGKYICKTKVVHEENAGAISLKQSVIRTLFRLIDGILFYLVGLIIVLSNKNRQRLGDMAAKTIVIKE